MIGQKIGILLEMIKFKLTIFAMPFAFTGAFLAARGLPGWWPFWWIVVAMVGARTSAMGFNRIVDWRFDQENPRTAGRALPAGKVKRSEAWSMVILAGLLFFFACWQLNPLTLWISPLVLGLTYFYSYTKRFTALCHLVLGVALAFSPFGGWIAVKGAIDGFPLSLSLGVVLWVAGFDTIYACLDADYDRQRGLYSLPSRLGAKKAFRLAGFFHGAAFLFFIMAGWQCQLNSWYYLGILLAGLALWYQHHLVNPDDLSRIQLSFFSMNGLISLVIFLATCLALYTESISK